MSNNEDLRRDLLQAIESGLKAEAAKVYLLTVIHSQRERIYKEIEAHNSVYYQNIDNSAVSVPHFELRVLRQMENAISDAIRQGVESQERLRKMDEPKAEPRSGLRF